MKFKKTMMITVASLACISSVANANIILKGAAGDKDYCSTIPGNWSGTGTIKSSNLTCNYTGTGVVRATANPSQFTMDVSMQKSSGSKLCPPDANLQNLSATCVNNTITMSEMGVDLTGQLTNNGNTASINGTVDVPAIGTVSADIHLTKQSS